MWIGRNHNETMLWSLRWKKFGAFTIEPKNVYLPGKGIEHPTIHSGICRQIYAMFVTICCHDIFIYLIKQHKLYFQEINWSQIWKENQTVNNDKIQRENNTQRAAQHTQIQYDTNFIIFIKNIFLNNIFLFIFSHRIHQIKKSHLPTNKREIYVYTLW